MIGQKVKVEKKVPTNGKRVGSVTFQETILPTMDINLIIPSESPIQKLHRKYYVPKKQDELNESIKKDGILYPPYLRPHPTRKGYFELVAGERRWRGATAVGMKEIPYILKNLTDDQVNDLQVTENTARLEIPAMEQAYICKYYRDERKLSPQETTKFINLKTHEIEKLLKLVDLPESVRTALENGEITEKHAFLIAPHPKEDHEKIFALLFNNYGYTSQSLYPFKKAKDNIEWHYLLRLDKAKFDLNSTELHPFGLACIDCKQRTGAQGNLFSGELAVADSCLDRECFESKERTFVEIKRVVAVVNNHNVPKEKAIENVDKVPILSGSYANSDPLYPGEKLLSIEEYYQVTHPGECQKNIPAIYGLGEKQGQKTFICLKTANCSVHNPKPTPVAAKAAPTKATIPSRPTAQTSPKKEVIVPTAEELIEKERAFDAKIFRPVSRKVVLTAAGNIENEKEIFANEDFTFKLLVRLWEMQCRDTEQAEEIRHILRLSETELITERFEKHETHQRCLQKLDATTRARLLFLILFAEVDDTSPNEAEIKKLAEIAGFDYRYHDAEERLKQCREVDQKTFHNYLTKLENNPAEEIPIPRVWFPDYKKEENLQ